MMDICLFGALQKIVLVNVLSHITAEVFALDIVIASKTLYGMFDFNNNEVNDEKMFVQV